MDIYNLRGKILFSSPAPTLKECLQEAVREGANLKGAYLRGANLYGANFMGANLKGAFLEGSNFEIDELKNTTTPKAEKTYVKFIEDKE